MNQESVDRELITKCITMKMMQCFTIIARKNLNSKSASIFLGGGKGGAVDARYPLCQSLDKRL